MFCTHIRISWEQCMHFSIYGQPCWRPSWIFINLLSFDSWPFKTYMQAPKLTLYQQYERKYTSFPVLVDTWYYVGRGNLLINKLPQQPHMEIQSQYEYIIILGTSWGNFRANMTTLIPVVISQIEFEFQVIFKTEVQFWSKSVQNRQLCPNKVHLPHFNALCHKTIMISRPIMNEIVFCPQERVIYLHIWNNIF